MKSQKEDNSKFTLSSWLFFVPNFCLFRMSKSSSSSSSFSRHTKSLGSCHNECRLNTKWRSINYGRYKGQRQTEKTPTSVTPTIHYDYTSSTYLAE